MNDYIKSCLMHVDPFAKETDLEEIKELNEYEVYFKFKDGRKTIYDSLTGYSRGVYKKDSELTDDEWSIIFGKNLYRTMIHKCVNQEELALLVGTSQGTISNYIRGRSSPDVKMARKLARALECEIDDFFYKEL